MISDSHIQDFATFDYLLCEEMYALRRTFGYYWFGKQDITNLVEKHINEKKIMNELLKFKYNSNIKLSDYLYDYVMIDVNDRIVVYRNIENTDETKINIMTEDEKNKYYILKKLFEYRKIYEIEFEKINEWVPCLMVVEKALEKYRIELQNIHRPKLNINYHDLTKCCICFDSENPINCITNCKHQFHKSCIELWTDVKNCCPICRQDLPEISYVNISYVTEV
jgi:hypothetical protein